MPITTASFDSAFWPDDVTGATARAGHRRPVRPLAHAARPRRATCRPRANPSGFGWVGEGQPLPAVALGDDADVIAVAKLAGLITFSNESLDDPDEPVGDLLSAAVADAMGPELDAGLLFGAGGVDPDGCFSLAPEAIGGADFRADVIGAWAELVDAGADPSSIVVLRLRARDRLRAGAHHHRRRADPRRRRRGDGRSWRPHDRGPLASAGQTLVADVSRLFLVVRNDFEAKFSDQAAFANDQALCRIKGRFAAACPQPAKTLRKITAAP